MVDGATPQQREKNVRTRGRYAWVRVLKPLTMMFYGEGIEGTEEVTVLPCRRMRATDLYAQGATLAQMRDWGCRGWVMRVDPDPRTRRGRGHG